MKSIQDFSFNSHVTARGIAPETGSFPIGALCIYFAACAMLPVRYVLATRPKAFGETRVVT